MFNISDLIVILIIALAAFLGYRKGFIKTSFRMVSFIVAIILSMILYKPVAGYIKEHTGVSEWIVSTITKEEIINNNEEIVEEEITNDTEEIDIAEEMRSDTEESLVKEEKEDEKKKIEDVLSNLPENVKDYIDADETINKAKEHVAIKIADTIINIMSMIIIYLVAKLLLMIVCFILDGIMQIPVLKQINEIAGLVLGILLGIIQVYTTLAVITFLSSFVEMPGLIAYIKSSLITSVLFEYNLLIALIF
ncbi:MAG: CvpA family protein [Clostridia bacterium]|nr:CvpA family protein [Clostridia bacterium]